MTAVLSEYDSPYFPFQISWKVGAVRHSNVFETAEQARGYIIGQYGKVRIIDKARCTMQLTQKDKRLLLSWQFEEKDFAQIEGALSGTNTKYSVDGRRISRQKAIELLGREVYLSGIARSAFHYTSVRQARTGERVMFDSHNLFR